MTLIEEYSLVCGLIDTMQKAIQHNPKERLHLQAELEELQQQLMDLRREFSCQVQRFIGKVKSNKGGVK